MCFPAAVLIPAIVGIAQAGLSAVQSIGAYSAERQAAKESERAYQEQRTLNAQAANRSYQQSQAQLKGEFDQASQKAEGLLVQRLQAQGSTLAAGRSGQSIGGLLTDAQRTEGRDLATLGMNLGYAQQDYAWNVLDVFEQHKSANITAAAQRKAMPSTGGLLLGLGSAALSGISAAVPLMAPASGGGGGGGSSGGGGGGSSQYQPGAGPQIVPSLPGAKDYSGAFKPKK
jgi:hypothetical protein